VDCEKPHEVQKRRSVRTATGGTLYPFPKGVSGNPAGSTPGHKIVPRTFTEICRAYLDGPISAANPRTRAEALATALYIQGMKGNTKAVGHILDRVDPALRRVAIEGVPAVEGNAMLERMLQSTSLPVRNGNGSTNGKAT